MKILPIVITALSLSLTGCFNSEAPKCSDEDVQATVKSVYQEVYQNAQNDDNFLVAEFAKSLPKELTKLSMIRATAYDDKIKLRECKADALFDTNQTYEIKYSVQLDEKDSDKYYIELDTEFLSSLMQENLMHNMLKTIK